MDENRQEISIELENIRTTIANLDKALARSDKEIVELPASRRLNSPPPRGQKLTAHASTCRRALRPKRGN